MGSQYITYGWNSTYILFCSVHACGTSFSLDCPTTTCTTFGARTILHNTASNTIASGRSFRSGRDFTTHLAHSAPKQLPTLCYFYTMSYYHKCSDMVNLTFIKIVAVTWYIGTSTTAYGRASANISSNISARTILNLEAMFDHETNTRSRGAYISVDIPGRQ